MNRVESPEEIARMLQQDNIELKRTGRGIHGRASRTGRISSMRMPSDIAGKEYKKSSKAISFNVEDILQMLKDTPTIRDMMMERIGEEHKHYEDAIGKVLEGVDGVVSKVMEQVVGTIGSMVELVNSQATRIDQLERDLDKLRSNNSKISQERARLLALELEQISKGFEEVSSAQETTNVMPLKNATVKPRRPRTSGKITKEELYEMAKGLESRGLEVNLAIVRVHAVPIQSKLYGPSKYWNGITDFVSQFTVWKEQPLQTPPTPTSDDFPLQSS